ncbi:hypothetical protein FRX31_012444 [Thalictrum thalictroides]|uniref:Uncharacterized protein n=1 Tax=Thalictrum thalictroides TaxID=46969 RepID=A0A7J6WKQ5_THATH|nr:hypothetical protein FRX31_012444 [Thalictrum thalictroides]
MIHKKGGRIRTYGRVRSARPRPAGLGGRVPSSSLSPKQQMRCATQHVTLSPLALFWLCHYQSRVTPSRP